MGKLMSTIAVLAPVGAGAAAAILGAHVAKRDKIGPLPISAAVGAAFASLAFFAGKKYRGGLLLIAGGALGIAIAQEISKRLTTAGVPQLAGHPFAVGKLGSGATMFMPANATGPQAYASMYEAAGLAAY